MLAEVRYLYIGGGLTTGIKQHWAVVPVEAQLSTSDCLELTLKDAADDKSASRFLRSDVWVETYERRRSVQQGRVHRSGSTEESSRPCRWGQRRCCCFHCLHRLRFLRCLRCCQIQGRRCWSRQSHCPNQSQTSWSREMGGRQQELQRRRGGRTALWKVLVGWLNVAKNKLMYETSV